MTTSIILAKRHHCGQMVRRLGAGQRQSIIGLGLDPHREIVTTFNNSGESYAWIVDGKMEGLGGVVGSLAGSSGNVWLALSDVATRWPVTVARQCLRQLDIFLKTREELTTTVLKDDGKSLKFAYRLGFERREDDLMDKMGIVLMRIGRG